MIYIVGNKGESQNECFKKTKHAKFFENEHFLASDTHMYVCVSEAKKCSFFEKFGVLCFLETPVLRFAFLPITDDDSSTLAQLRDIAYVLKKNFWNTTSLFLKVREQTAAFDVF